MKNFLLSLVLLCFLQACNSSESLFELNKQQSMCMIGKGPGQDAAINPYSGEKSRAIVKNLGQNEFSIRIQKGGEVVEEIGIQPRERKEVLLLENYELYLDTELASKARLTFKKYDD